MIYSRAIALLVAAALFLAAPVAADHSWRPHHGDRLEQMETELAPVMARVGDARDGLPAALSALSSQTTVSGLTAATAVAQGAFDELEDIASDGLSVLDRYPPAPCWSDHHAVTTTGFLLLGDAAQDDSDSSQRFMRGIYLLLDYGSGIRSVVDC